MVTFIRPSTRDQLTDLKVPKLGSLTEIPAQILSRAQIVNFRTAAPTKSWLEQVSEHVSLQRYMQSNQENALIILRQLSSMEWTAQRFLHCSSAMAVLKHTSPKSPELSIRSVSGRALSPFYSQKSTLRCLFLFFGYLGDSLSGIISECSPVILLDFKRSIGRVRCENRLESPS